MSKIARIYQGINEIQKYYQGGVLQRLFFDWKHYIGNELNIEHGKECVGRNVIVNGKTYQNLFTGGEWVQKHLSGVVQSNRISNTLRIAIKQNTVYILEILKDETSNILVGVDGFTDSTYNYKTFSLGWKDGEKVSFKITDTTITHIGILAKRKDDSAISINDSDVLSLNIKILEGDYTDIDLPSNIDGIESVGEREDINLLKNIAWYDGFINMDTGEVETSTKYPNAKYSELIDIDINQLYKTNIDESDSALRIRIYKSDGTYIKIASNAPTLNSFANLYEARNIYAGIAKTGIVKIRLLALDTVNYPLPNKPYVIRNNEDINYPYPININNKGKNLLNPNDTFISSSGLVVSTANVKPNTNYYVKVYNSTYTGTFSYYVFINEWAYKDSLSLTKGVCIKTPNNCTKIGFNGFDESTNTEKRIIQVEEGTVATSYEPYREPIITNLKLPIPLRSLPDGTCDTIEGNKLIQRVGKVIFDGSADESWGNGYISDGINNRFQITKRIELDESRHGSRLGYCDHFSVVINNSIPPVGSMRMTFTEEVIYFLFNPSTNIVPLENVSAWKAWLSENPVTVYFPLATPIETEITPDKILINGEPITDTVGIELPDGTCDSIENGCYVKRVEKVIFDENIKTYQTLMIVNNNVIIRTRKFSMAIGDGNIISNATVISWMHDKNNLDEVTETKIMATSSASGWNEANIIIPSSYFEGDITMEVVKEFLAENPVTMYYELMTPIKIPLFSIKEGLTTLRSTNNITPQIELDCLVRDDFQNMCDNEWETGFIDLNTGVNKDIMDRIRLVNDIQVKPNTIYRIDIINSVPILNTGLIGARFYNSSKKYLGNDLAGNIKSPTYTFTTPADCYYIRFIAETTNVNFKIYLKEVIN